MESQDDKDPTGGGVDNQSQVELILPPEESTVTVADWLGLANDLFDQPQPHEIKTLAWYLRCEHPELLHVDSNQQLAQLINHSLECCDLLPCPSHELCTKFQQELGIDLMGWYEVERPKNKKRKLQGNNDTVVQNNQTFFEGKSAGKSTPIRYSKDRHRTLKGAVHKMMDKVRYIRKPRFKRALKRGNYTRRKQDAFDFVAEQVIKIQADGDSRDIRVIIEEELLKEKIAFDDLSTPEGKTTAVTSLKSEDPKRLPTPKEATLAGDSLNNGNHKELSTSEGEDSAVASSNSENHNKVFSKPEGATPPAVASLNSGNPEERNLQENKNVLTATLRRRNTIHSDRNLQRLREFPALQGNEVSLPFCPHVENFVV